MRNRYPRRLAILIGVIVLLAIACRAPTEPKAPKGDGGDQEWKCWHTYLDPENPRAFKRERVPCPGDPK